MLAGAFGFGVGVGAQYVGAVERHLQDFGQVKGMAGCALSDLFAATEAVGDD
jgi:hypothetical protein